MYILITLFFISLTGIVAMVGKKLAIIEDIHLMDLERDYVHPFVPHIEKIKFSMFGFSKKCIHLAVVVVLKAQVKSTNFIHKTRDNINHKLQVMMRAKNENGEPQEVSKFLRMVTDYKHKIREIKHRIHEEEAKN